jgi:hypothetical protein
VPDGPLGGELADRDQDGREGESPAAQDEGDDRHHRADDQHPEELGQAHGRLEDLRQPVDRLEDAPFERTHGPVADDDRARDEPGQPAESRHDVQPAAFERVGPCHPATLPAVDGRGKWTGSPSA